MAAMDWLKGAVLLGTGPVGWTVAATDYAGEKLVNKAGDSGVTEPHEGAGTFGVEEKVIKTAKAAGHAVGSGLKAGVKGIGLAGLGLLVPIAAGVALFLIAKRGLK